MYFPPPVVAICNVGPNYADAISLGGSGDRRLESAAGGPRISILRRVIANYLDHQTAMRMREV